MIKESENLLIMIFFYFRNFFLFAFRILFLKNVNLNSLLFSKDFFMNMIKIFVQFLIACWVRMTQEIFFKNPFSFLSYKDVTIKTKADN